MIRIDGLSIARGNNNALHEVSTMFESGGITALIGPNGAGKSTLLHAVAGLLPPSSGRIEIDGRDISLIRPQERALTVSLLTQNENVTARLTVEELVSFGRWPHHRGRATAEDQAKVVDALASFDLTPLATRILDTLSGGQRQRAFVAMAYAQETPWMLLDEPLSALDPRHSRDIMERLHSLSRPGSAQRNVVLVLHDLGVAARYADRIVALKDGMLVAAGCCEETLTGEMLSDLFDTGLNVVQAEGKYVVVPE